MYDPYAYEPDGCNAAGDRLMDDGNRFRTAGEKARRQGNAEAALDLDLAAVHAYSDATRIYAEHVQHRRPMTRRSYYGGVIRKLIERRPR
jgi:hypothetical protein